MPWIPEKITININVHFDRFVVEHLDNSAAVQKAIDDATAKILANNEALKEAQKGG